MTTASTCSHYLHFPETTEYIDLRAALPRIPVAAFFLTRDKEVHIFLDAPAAFLLMRMLQRKLAGQGVNITIGNAIARGAGVNKKCEINLSSKLEEVDFAFFMTQGVRWHFHI